MIVFFNLRKTYMTLLETLIAMTLLSVLLVFVFGFFRELSVITNLSEQAQKESFQMRYLESRLGFIFERIVNESRSDRKFYFYTQPAQRDFSNSASLIFTFNNNVRLDPTFSGDVLGRLYVDLDHCLRLAIWPLHVSDPDQYLQEEVLCQHVMDISYSLYAAPEQVKNRTDIVSPDLTDPEKKTPAKDTWHKEWALTYQQMPSIIKIIVQVAKNPEKIRSGHTNLKMETNELVFEFALPSSLNHVYYLPDPS